jgi:hypothetical protein
MTFEEERRLRDFRKKWNESQKFNIQKAIKERNRNSPSKSSHLIKVKPTVSEAESLHYAMVQAPGFSGLLTLNKKGIVIATIPPLQMLVKFHWKEAEAYVKSRGWKLTPLKNY